MIAPLPALDSVLAPFSLDALTLAKTEDPQARLYGAALSTYAGILQDLAATIAGSSPLQKTS